MKYLLTSAGIRNPRIHDALIDLLGKPIAEASALCIPTAGYGHPRSPLIGPGGSLADKNPKTPGEVYLSSGSGRSWTPPAVA